MTGREVPNDVTVYVIATSNTQPKLHLDDDCMAIRGKDDDKIRVAERGKYPNTELCTVCVGEHDTAHEEPRHYHDKLRKISKDEIPFGKNGKGK